MRMMKVVFLVFFSFHGALSDMIMDPYGYKIVTERYFNYINKPLDEVKRELSKIYPNIEFIVDHYIDYLKRPPDFYMNKVRIPINSNNIVVEPPKYFGREPDMFFLKFFINLPVGKAIAAINLRLPEMKIIVRSIETNKVVWEGLQKSKSYILLRVSEDGIMRVKPQYMYG